MRERETGRREKRGRYSGRGERRETVRVFGKEFIYSIVLDLMFCPFVMEFQKIENLFSLVPKHFWDIQKFNMYV